MKAKLMPLMKSDKQDWQTPKDFFQVLDDEFDFDADLADDNGITVYNRRGDGSKIPGSRHFPCDSLSKNWPEYRGVTATFFLNPPYSTTQQNKFIKKAYKESSEGCTIVCLIPARPDTERWQEFCSKAYEIRFIKGRLTFQGAANSATFPSAIVIFRPHKEPVQSVKFWDWKNEI